MKRTLIAALSLGLAAFLAAPASAGYLLVDDFDDQDVTSELLMSDAATYAPWLSNYTTGGATLLCAEVGGAGSGNYAISAPNINYANLGLRSTGSIAGTGSSWLAGNHTAESSWASDITHFQFRLYNLSGAEMAARTLKIFIGWQLSDDMTAGGGRGASYTMDLPTLASGQSTLINLKVGADGLFGAFGSEDNVMLSSVLFDPSDIRGLYSTTWPSQPFPNPQPWA